MNILSLLYTELLWRPLLNSLVFIYAILPWQDVGIATVILTILTRVIVLPLHLKAQRAQKDLARIQPEIKRIQEQYKNDREKQGQMLMELYQKHKVNPFSGCLIMLIQLPILIALFSVFRNGLSPESFDYLYGFVPNPGALNPISFGIIDVTKGNIYLGVFAAITQFIQSKITTPPVKTDTKKKNDFSQIFQKQMMYLFPVLIVFWSVKFPAALLIYWTTLNVFGIIQELILKKFGYKKEVD